MGNENGFKVNPQLVIENLLQANTQLTHENAMLRAALQEQAQSAADAENSPAAAQEGPKK